MVAWLSQMKGSYCDATSDPSASFLPKALECPFLMISDPPYGLGTLRTVSRAVTLVALSTKVVTEMQHDRVRVDQQG